MSRTDTRRSEHGGSGSRERGKAQNTRQGLRAEMGRRLRALRVARGMTLREAGAAAGLSPSFIGMLERGQSEIAISRLIALADVYGASVADLLGDVHRPAPEHVPLAEALVPPGSVDGVRVAYLASPSWSMEPFIVELAPGARLENLHHSTEEFVHCLEGRPTLVVEAWSKTLNPGDTVVLPGGVVHEYANETAAPARLIGAVHHHPVERRRAWAAPHHGNHSCPLSPRTPGRGHKPTDT